MKYDMDWYRGLARTGRFAEFNDWLKSAGLFDLGITEITFHDATHATATMLVYRDGKPFVENGRVKTGVGVLELDPPAPAWLL